jgi:translation initiation factor IF-1
VKAAEIGLVRELLPGGLVKVSLERTNEEMTVHVAEEFRRVSVPLRAGDRVKLRRAALDPKRGTIISRAGGQ